jgi:hypothetical protein
MCVVGAINNYTAALEDSSSPCKNQQRHRNRDPCARMINLCRELYELTRTSTLTSVDPTESLMFLAHFVGDVHQPLHCGNADDLGGNTIVVHWYRRKSNLHKVLC